MQDTIIYAITAGSLLILLVTTLATPRKVNVQANQWLAFFLFSFACIVLDRVFVNTSMYREYPAIMGLLEITRLAMSPALYFSVLYFTTPDRIRKRSDLLHFVPFILFGTYILIAITGLSDSFLFSWYGKLPEFVRKGVALTIFTALKVQMIVYWIASYYQLTRHTRNIRVFASTTGPVSLWWLRYFLLGLAGALFLSLNEVIEFIPPIIPLTHFGYLFLVFYLAYCSLRQQEVYPYQQKDVAEIRDIIEESSRNTSTKRFSDEELVTAKQNLVRVMETEKVYLDPNLGLPMLANRVSLSTHDLSYLINEGFGENFFLFVNRYRIEEAKMLLRSDRHKHLNMLGIAYESGFRSKSTFNSTFKKITGLSPSQYMQSAVTADEKAA